MKDIKLKNGLKLTVDETVLYENMEIVDEVAQVQAGNIFALSTLTLHLLGESNRKLLYDKLRGEDGKVSPTEVEQSVVEIITLMAQKEEDGKN